MFFKSTNAYQESKRFAIESLSKEDVVVKLFEEAAKQLKMAVILTERQEFVKVYNCIAKSQQVISSRLQNSLDMRYPMLIELDEMYSFIYTKLGEANVSRDIKPSEIYSYTFTELRDSFEEASRLSNSSQNRGL